MLTFDSMVVRNPCRKKNASTIWTAERTRNTLPAFVFLHGPRSHITPNHPNVSRLIPSPSHANTLYDRPVMPSCCQLPQHAG
jgi:hypothetical protein